MYFNKSLTKTNIKQIYQIKFKQKKAIKPSYMLLCSYIFHIKAINCRVAEKS